ncbi:hypothetical protein SpCBS45565_g06516 [Spizellomyces sp. 'palustris']|nr:hypothetical protein SpCBS45565_g06516 [Spizellomyces sp. 'palustris']
MGVTLAFTAYGTVVLLRGGKAPPVTELGKLEQQGESGLAGPPRVNLGPPLPRRSAAAEGSPDKARNPNV